MSSGGQKSKENIDKIKSGEHAEYSKVDEVAGIKVISHKDQQAKIPRLAGNSEMYLVVSDDGTFHYLTIYEDNGLVIEIDLDRGKIHAHIWEEKPNKNGVNTIRRAKNRSDPDHEEPLTEEQKQLVRKIVREAKKDEKIKARLPEGLRGRLRFL